MKNKPSYEMLEERIQALEKAADDCHKPEVPLTTRGTFLDILIDHGGNGFLQKPFDIGELPPKLREVLDAPEA